MRLNNLIWTKYADRGIARGGDRGDPMRLGIFSGLALWSLGGVATKESLTFKGGDNVAPLGLE
jgi:hypothetical protein